MTGPVVPTPPAEVPEEPLSVEFRQRLIAAVERPLRMRREILNLAAHACGHLCGPGRGCHTCHRDWPCPDVHAAARAALDAVADLTPDPHSSGGRYDEA